MGQCRKSEEQRQGMRLVHQELVEKDFMKKLSDFDEDTQDFITNTAFQHYNPWRIVLKEDSISTPVRMVMDPTPEHGGINTSMVPPSRVFICALS